MRTFLDGRVTLHAGDSRDVLKTLPDACIDSVVTDPPYALVSIVKRFGKEGSAPAKGNEAYARASAGFMGKQWDTGEVAFAAEFWSEVLRVLKPGGHVVAFSGTRTYHRMTCAIEDAGFEIRDQIGWVFGSGFPKSHDVSKAMDKAAGAEREIVGKKRNNKGESGVQTYAALGAFQQSPWSEITAPATDDAREWFGWGTALKPAWEPICLARKPLIGTVAANVLEHGTGAINVDGCRVGDGGQLQWTKPRGEALRFGGDVSRMNAQGDEGVQGINDKGRFPANLIHDGSDEVIAAFPELGKSTGGRIGNAGGGDVTNIPVGAFSKGDPGFGDSGSAARFFYTAKADADDRLGSKHPTVKPLDLMQYLVRLVTPKGGTVLDPFAGTGTTGEAAWREGMSAILIERESDYREDIARRMELATNPTKRAAVASSKNNLTDPNTLPLFAGAAE